VAGKTGTSEGARDLWFIGTIPQLTTGIWLGYDNNHETGGASSQAAWAWNQFMTPVVKDMPVKQFPPKPVLHRSFKPPASSSGSGSQGPAAAPWSDPYAHQLLQPGAGGGTGAPVPGPGAAAPAPAAPAAAPLAPPPPAPVADPPPAE
jgi:penicillin-binding protein 1A